MSRADTFTDTEYAETSIVDNDRDEAIAARNAVDGGGTRRVAGALIDTTDLPDAAEVQGL